MALAQIQRALATLATSDAARERLRDDPGTFARDFALAPVELAQLRSIGESRVLAYVDSLQRKRVAEAVRLLPLSARAGGPALRRAFGRHARRVPLGAGKARYLRDVLAFARHAHVALSPSKGVTPELAGLLDYEATGLRAAYAPAFFRIRAYAFPVRRVAHALARGEPWDGFGRRRTVVVWLAAGGRRVTVALG